MEYSSSTQMENQMESGKKAVITKEELNDHYSTVSNAGDRRMQSENAMRTKDSVKEEISTAEVENTDCHESTKPDKQRASKSASFGSHLKKEEISYVLGTMVFPPEMSLSSLYCPSSTPEETMTNKMQEVGRAQSSNSCGIRVGEKPFKCDVCQKKFNTDGELTKHKRIHTGERPFECNVCEKNFTIRANLIVHERIHAGENPYICQTCGQGFNHKISLHRHQRRQHADPNADTIPHVSHLQHLPSSVPQADASWESSPMEKFIITDSPKADMIPAKRPATIEPTLIETKINGSSSPDTGRSKHSVRKSGLGDHNDGGPDVDDDMNEIGLSNQRHAEANTNNATDDCDGGQFACLDCTAMFETKAAFKKHIATHEGYRRHKCTVCEKRFTTNKNLMVHMRRHKGERPFKCDICDKKFTTCGELTIHMRIHTGERPFKCNVCEKKFANSGNLIVHERSHTGERPFKCDICDKKCTTRSDLTVHKRIHTGEKPFGCDICEKKFTTSGHLTIHKRIHTGERLYKCDTCEMRYISGERPFVCPTCQKRFSRSGDLHRHTLSHTDPDADMQPDVSHLRHLPSSAPQADGSRESSPMEEFIITD